MSSENTASEKITRLCEIDFLRGLAILLMVSYHLIYDLKHFGIESVSKSIQLPALFWGWYPDLSSTSFLILVGVSAVLKNRNSQKSFFSYHKKTIQVLSSAMLITLVTLFVPPYQTVYFGILHCIGISLLMVKPFLRFRYFNILIGTLLFALNELTKNTVVTSHWLIWAGINPAGFLMIDYFPLIPFFGFVLIGVGIGRIIYIDNCFNIATYPRLLKAVQSRLGLLLQKLGKSSLLIYLLHQPLIFGLLYILGLTHL